MYYVKELDNFQEVSTSQWKVINMTRISKIFGFGPQFVETGNFSWFFRNLTLATYMKNDILDKK